MSRYAVDVGRRGLHTYSAFSIAITTTTSPSLRTSSIPAVRPATHPISGSLGRLESVRSRHVAATNTPFRWRGSPTAVATLGWRTSIHAPARVWERSSRGTPTWIPQRRWNSGNKTFHDKTVAEDAQKLHGISREPHIQKIKEDASVAAGIGATGKSLYDRLPHLHRPTKEELLDAANGFWHRLQIRFKWFSIRSVRPFNHDEIFAFMSWIFWGHFLWLVIGTTTFVSLAIWALNTIFAQETLAGWIGQYLTKSSGISVIFESAVVPRWGDGVISFNKVFVSRRPTKDKRQRSVTKGSSTTAAAAAATALQADKERSKDGQSVELSTSQEDDGNYTQFDVTIENVEVTLSFTKWFNGKGLLRDVSVSGVRGVLDRTAVQPRVENVDPKSYRREHDTGDFEIDNFKMEDVLLTVYQPNSFRPFQVSVFNCELPRLRKQWLFYDFLCANTAHGSFDNSLFTIHPRQIHGTTGVSLVEGREEEASQWRKHSRLRLDGLKIDHLNRGVEGPFSWIHEGNVDIVADIMIPNDADGSIAKVMSDFYDRMEATVTSQAQGGQPTSQARDQQGNVINNEEESLDRLQDKLHPERTQDDNRFVVMDIQIHLNDVRASVPIFTRDLSYVNQTVVRPIVAYINSHSHRSSNYIPISCRIVKRQSEFDGSWTVFDSGLLDDLSRETYEAFARDIMDRKQRQRRIKKVGLWAAQVAAQALFIGLAGQLA